MQIITCDKMSINILIERNARMRYADLKWTFTSYAIFFTRFIRLVSCLMAENPMDSWTDSSHKHTEVYLITLTQWLHVSYPSR